MWRAVAGSLAVVPLLAGCGGAAAGVATPAEAGPLGCSGWYAVSADTLTATMSFSGPVRTLTLSALLDDGTIRASHLPVRLTPTTTARTLRLPNVDKAVTSVIATLTGPGAQHSACELSSPH